MRLILYLGNIITPIVLFGVVIYGIFERKKVFELFIEGVKDGEKIVINLFPILLALLVSISMLYSSGVVDFVAEKALILIPKLNKYKEILPFVMLRPISGSSSMAIGTSLMQKYGVDSDIGIIISLIMGSTETTIYIVSVYGSKLGKKNLKPVLILGLLGDLICVITALVYFKFRLVC